MSEALHEFRFPGESAEYRRARDELLESEIDLRRRLERVAQQRRALPTGGAAVTDHAFDEWDVAANAPRRTYLSELFAPGRATLFLYSFMVVAPEQGLGFVGPCPSCTSIIDGIDGAVAHIVQRVSFAVAAKTPIGEFREHGARRGWRNVRLLSAAPSGYNRDYGAEDADGFQSAVATVFVRRDGNIRHFWSSELVFAQREPGQGPRHVDFMWPIWSVLDMMPDGRGEQEPQLEYD